MEEILNEQNFDEKVLNSKGNVLVEFFATWCPHCHRMQPIVDKVAAEAQGITKVYQVDIDQSPNLAQEYAPAGVPTFVLFKDGKNIDKLVGEQTEDRLLDLAGALTFA